ncbi:glycine zipper family protein [Sorangium sp. So ce1335]|uniref:glycine zipper family protein n=1 Tax=Sorangium sp. So ce1335 TaxID=3133335 RepID=UPI003F631DB6
MTEVLAASLMFPAVIFTVVLALALIYWLFVLLGALDLDLLGGAHGDAAPDLGALEGATKGALEGATKGALEGATKGALEGATKGALEGSAKGALEGSAKGALEGSAKGMADVGDGAHGAGSLLVALKLHRVPATVSLTLVAAFGWFSSVLSTMLVEPAWLGAGLPRWALGLAVLAGSLTVALLLTSLAVRPIAPLFVTRHAQAKKDLVGRVCVISTGRVDERFGQAVIEEGGASHILDVRCDTPGALRRGDRALLVSWDPNGEVFGVEPLDALLGPPPPLAQRVASHTDTTPDGAEDDAIAAARAENTRQRGR